MPGDAGRPCPAIYHEIMTTRFTGDRRANGVLQRNVAGTGPQHSPKIGGVVLA